MDLYISLLILGLIGVIVSAIQAISSIGGFLGIIIGSLIGSLGGVFFGFKLNDIQRKKLERERRLFFRNLLMLEVKKSIDLIEGTVNLIPVDAWNSVVNSGDIALCEDKAIELSDLYFEIQNYNYEAKRVRDAIEEAWRHPTLTAEIRASMLKTNFNDQTKPTLLKHLKELEEWLKPPNMKNN